MRIFAYILLLLSLAFPSSALAQGGSIEYRDHPFYYFDSEQNLTADIALADVDGDGDLDALTANGRHWAQQDWVFFNSGKGRMLEAAPIGQRLSASYILAPGDFDGDGDTDIVVVRDNLPAQVFFNDGNGHFSFANNIKNSSAPARSATVLDADDDGALDIAIITRRGDDVIYFGSGAGTFPTQRKLPGNGKGSTGIAANDLDNDGDTDLVIARRNKQPSIVMINDGRGHFSAKNLKGSVGDHRKVVIADFDQDNLPDIVLVSTRGTHKIYKTTEAKDFSSVSVFGSEGHRPQAMAAADLDGDGDIDLVEGTETTNALYLNQGKGLFERQELPGDSADTYGVTIGDMNGDKKLDLIFANSGSVNVVMVAK